MKVNVHFDFESLKVCEGEAGEDQQQTIEMLKEGRVLLSELRNYHGNAESIRVALSNSGDVDVQRASFTTIRPNIESISKFYRLSADISQYASNLAKILTTANDILNNLPSMTLLGEIVLFCFEFDQEKMAKPEIQNDFSFYRRSLGSAATGDEVLPLPTDDANVVSMWLAQALPMMTAVCNALKDNSIVLAHLANVCYGMLYRKSYQENDKSRLVQIMIISAIMYDRVSGKPGGIFASNKEIKVKNYIRLLKRDGGSHTQQLGQCMKYSTLHFNDDSTPSSVKRDLDRL